MSREIKFRVWDKDKREWLGASDPNTLTYYGFHLFGEVMQFQHIPPEALSTIEVNEFTGLKDKNGVEIYEGDIIEDHHIGMMGTETTRIDYVRFNSDPAGFTLGDRWSPLNSTDIKRMRVIGNIYENPELLEGGNA